MAFSEQKHQQPYFENPMITLQQLVIAAIGAIASASIGTAATLFSNVNQPVSSCCSPCLFSGDIMANGFLTGSDTSTLTGVSLRLFNLSADVPATGAMAHLYDDNGAEPGTLLGTFTPATSTELSPGQSDTIISFSHPGISLQPNHAYWIALTGDLYCWRATSSLATDAGSGSVFTVNTTLGLKGGPSPLWIRLSADPNAMFVLTGTIDAVPEPAPTVLLVIGLFVPLLLCRGRLRVFR